MLTQFSTYKLMWGCRTATHLPKSAQKQDCCSIGALRAYYQPELSDLATLWQGLMTVALHAFPQLQKLCKTEEPSTSWNTMCISQCTPDYNCCCRVNGLSATAGKCGVQMGKATSCRSDS